MDFVAHWKNWIRPLAMMIYFILMMIAVPLCIVEVTNHQKDKHVKAWFTGGVFTLLAVPISLWEIILHVINYTQPHLQKYIIRIIWMVPIYALNAWFALRFKETAIYLDTIRECYEAYVIYNFMAYLLSYLWTQHPQLEIALRRKRQQKHIIPFCCLPVWPMGSTMIQNCKHGVLQYTIVRPVTTVIALICELNHKYDEGDFNFKSAWSYLVIINNISQIWAMYCLVLFYQATKDMLAPIKPVPKFLCVKFVVFFSFWQAVIIAAFAEFDLIPQTEFYDYNVEDIAKALQDFCICIEMFLAAIMHYFAFSHKPFIDHSAEQGNCCQSFVSMWDVSDVKDDVVEHVKVISTTMKKTVSGQFRSKADDTEATPLLQMASDDHQNQDYTSSVQTTQADINHSGYQAQPDALSRTSDWDDTISVDRWQSPNKKQGTKSIASSMQNYLDLSTSIDNQSIHSQGIEHPEDRDSLRTKHRNDSDQTADDNQSDSVFLESNTFESNTKAGTISECENRTVIEESQKETEDSLIDFSEEKNQTDTEKR
ncbi:transmembrane protein 184C-like [Mercenaria mercenaria]|uniref:transmembrane protein 184C-like n=1 Tax=Mercenaria mercenaria TaxID=6596 RepID=UPI00234F4B17|nr:transmembrane protein 184C-like [Mercenaria mercenaria]